MSNNKLPVYVPHVLKALGCLNDTKGAEPNQLINQAKKILKMASSEKIPPYVVLKLKKSIDYCVEHGILLKKRGRIFFNLASGETLFKTTTRPPCDKKVKFDDKPRVHAGTPDEDDDDEESMESGASKSSGGGKQEDDDYDESSRQTSHPRHHRHHRPNNHQVYRMKLRSYRHQSSAPTSRSATSAGSFSTLCSYCQKSRRRMKKRNTAAAAATKKRERKTYRRRTNNVKATNKRKTRRGGGKRNNLKVQKARTPNLSNSALKKSLSTNKLEEDANDNDDDNDVFEPDIGVVHGSSPKLVDVINCSNPDCVCNLKKEPSNNKINE